MKKKLIGFSLKPIFRLLVAVGIIAFATSITAVSCGKTAGNNNNNNSGGGNPVVLGPVDPVIRVAPVKAAADANLVKVDASGNVRINAKVLGDTTTPFDVDGGYSLFNAMRLIDAGSANLPAVFTIEVMRNSTNAAEGGIILSVGEHATVPANDTNKNNISLKNAADSLTDANDGTLRGSVWRRSVDTAGANFYQIISYKRTFDVGATLRNQTAASIFCRTEKLEKVHDGATATDATKLPFAKATCHIGILVYNRTFATALQDISDAWVDEATSTEEDELRLMGIYTGDTGLGALSDATGWNKSKFFDALDNTAMQAIFTKNKYVEKAIKTTLVKSSAF